MAKISKKEDAVAEEVTEPVLPSDLPTVPDTPIEMPDVEAVAPEAPETEEEDGGFLSDVGGILGGAAGAIGDIIEDVVEDIVEEVIEEATDLIGGAVSSVLPGSRGRKAARRGG